MNVDELSMHRPHEKGNFKGPMHSHSPDYVASHDFFYIEHDPFLPVSSSIPFLSLSKALLHGFASGHSGSTIVEMMSRCPSTCHSTTCHSAGGHR